MTAYTIKPLEWDQWEQEGDISSASTISGTYFIFGPHSGGKFKAKHQAGVAEHRFPGNYDTLGAAKAACAEHWESLIKQALEEA